jgi:Zn-dependent protease with chaperone function
MTAGVDFDFARWIASRRSSIDQQAREGVAYAYVGELKFRRSLAAARPVTIAIEATTRLWRDVARAELLGSAVKVSNQQFPRVYQAAKIAGANLRVTVPTVFAASSGSIKVKALGTEDAPYLIINLELAEKLTDTELVAAIGHELGHIQNGHILYATALHYLNNSAAFFVRWVVQPAIMTLQAWSRRAEVTCDRASLLAVRNVDQTLEAMVKLAMGIKPDSEFSVTEYLRELPDPQEGPRPVCRAISLQPVCAQASDGAARLRRFGVLRDGHRPGSLGQAFRSRHRPARRRYHQRVLRTEGS